MHATRRTINSTKTLIGDYASSSDLAVIYGINLYYDHDLKMWSCPQPAQLRGLQEVPIYKGLAVATCRKICTRNSIVATDNL